MNNHKKLCHDLYWHYVDNGICAKCGAVWAEAGHRLCRECMIDARKRQKKYDPTGEKKRERQRKLREWRRANGLCYSCGGETDGQHKQCEKCLAKGRERALIKRIKKKIQKGLI